MNIRNDLQKISFYIKVHHIRYKQQNNHYLIKPMFSLYQVFFLLAWIVLPFMLFLDFKELIISLYNGCSDWLPGYIFIPNGI